VSRGSRVAPVRGEERGGRSPFVPLAETPRYPPPRRCIDPDRSRSWMRRALPILAAHRARFLTALVASFVGLVLQVEIPDLLNRTVNQAIVRRSGALLHDVALILLAGLGAGVAAYVSRLALLRTGYDVETDLRNLVYERLVRLSPSFYDRVQTGQLISRANSDLRSMQTYLTFAPMIVVQCAVALVAFGFMLSIDWQLALVVMAVMPLLYVAGTRMRRSMFPVSWLIQARLAEVATIVDENLHGVRVVKAFGAEPRQLRSLAKAAEAVEWAYVKDADLRARWSPVMQAVPQVGLALVLVFGGYLVVEGRLGVGAILAFSAYLVMLQAPFLMLGMLIMMSQRAAASAERVYELLDEEPAVVDRPGAVDLVHCEGDVRFSAVRFAYDPARGPVLVGLDLHVRPGETVAVVGRTGCGKSTLARLLVRFYDVDDGAVLLDGHDVRDLTLSSLRAHVAVVTDEPFLFSASIRDNIAYGRPDATDAEVEAAAAAAGALEFVSSLPAGLATVVGERGYTLSGGQRQRLVLARALLLDPSVLVLDDATSAVDAETEQAVHDALRRLRRGRTTILVAHRLSTIALADRVVLLDGGRVAAEGTHQELLASSPLYAEVLAEAEQAEAEQAEERAAAGRRPTTALGESPGEGAFVGQAVGAPGLGVEGWG
jgi:ATP-binding cassette subfamily B protein